MFGTITAISRAAITDDHLVLDPQGAMSLVVQHTHYMPKRWRGRENSDVVRIEFETLFQVKSSESDVVNTCLSHGIIVIKNITVNKYMHNWCIRVGPF